VRRASTRRRVAALSAALALCFAPALLATPPASTTIVEGVSIGMKPSAVLTSFGKPSWCLGLSTGDGECDWFAPPDMHIKGFAKPAHSIGAISVKFYKGTVFEIHLMAPDRARPEYRNVPLLSGWRTTKGIGLGSSMASVSSAYGGSHLEKVSYSAGTDLRLISKRGGKQVQTWFRFGPSSSGVQEIIVLVSLR
jgi:hypothetical protein